MSDAEEKPTFESHRFVIAFTCKGCEAWSGDDYGSLELELCQHCLKPLVEATKNLKLVE